VRDRLDEYVDGLLTPGEEKRVEEALARDAAMRAELDSVRRFRGRLEGVGEPKGARAWTRWAIAAALLAFLLWPESGPAPRAPLPDGRAYGERLAHLALARRSGRVPRRGVAALEKPPPPAFGMVYGHGLDRLGVTLDAPARAAAERAVKEHFVGTAALPDGVEGEWERTKRALRLYRRLRNEAGREAADAWYDMFRPGLVDRETTARLDDLRRRSDRYAAAYEQACRMLERRYGRRTLGLVLDRLAPDDLRELRRDAAQDGAAPDAVLAIRAAMYRVAVESQADLLYIARG